MGNAAEIYYFSGTGNSLAIARAIATRLGSDVTPILHALGESSLHSRSNVIGLVFPIYDSKAPHLVTDFVRRMEGIEQKYLFAVSTYGLAAGKALPGLRSAVHARGGELSGGFALAMPHNGIGCGLVATHRREGLLRDADARLDQLTAYVQSRRTGQVESSTAARAFFRPHVLRATPVLLRFLATLVTRGTQALAFQANNACIGCGTCERVCPVGNIRLSDGAPQWLDHCVNCFACLHWCPTNAISLGGLDMGMAQYHHPAVTLEDMDAQRR